MVIGTARVVVHIPSSQSLKDKRQVVKSILARLQRELHVAAAEVDEQDRRQVAVLGIACVSTSAAHADAMLARAATFVEAHLAEGNIAGFTTEIIHAL